MYQLLAVFKLMFRIIYFHGLGVLNYIYRTSILYYIVFLLTDQHFVKLKYLKNRSRNKSVNFIKHFQNY